ncbi:MAG TPA: NYN domain-containing protein, partial [Telluria sp.]
MASSSDNISMAVFCDFENVALGVRDANYEKFDIQPVLERLLLKGSIVVKKAYCDWERYKGFKAAMHESNFELIEIPHVRQSGKNSADIRLVVDALDLCYTKSHVNTFVIISGDSDFSPLVSKLRENNKHVIAVGVKQSTSDLLVANCDEFIFYDDLVREVKRTVAKREERKARPQAEKRPPSDESNRRKEELETRKALALEMVVETFDALISERGDSGKIWASLLKDTLKRRRPDFNESYFGFSTFGKLLEEAQTRGLLEFGRDEKSGAYVYRSQNAAAAIASDAGADEQLETGSDEQVDEPVEAAEAVAAPVNPRNNRPQQDRGQQERPRSRTSFRTPIVDTTSDDVPADDTVDEEDAQPVQPQPQNPRGRNRGRDRDRERQPVEAQAATVGDEDQQAQPQQEARGEPRGRNRNNRNRQPGEGQPAVNAGDAQQTQPGQPKPPKQEGRNRGRNRDRVPADGQPNRDANRERMPSEAQPKSHENALPPELRGRGRGRNGRNQNAPRYPEASEELAFHKQQQALEAAAAAA